MNCGKCGSKLKSASIYADRQRIPTGLFCPVCCTQITFSNELLTYSKEVLKENKEKTKSKPKFVKKQRRACPYCYENGIVNRSKWTIRKMIKKSDETQHWKCTCKKCGKVWTQSTSSEYFNIDPTQPKFTEGL